MFSLVIIFFDFLAQHDYYGIGLIDYIKEIWVEKRMVYPAWLLEVAIEVCLFMLMFGA